MLGNGDDVEGQSTAVRVHDVSGGGPMAWCRCVPCCWPTSAEQLAAEGSSEDPRHGGVSPPPPPAVAQVAETSGGACHFPPPHLHHLHPPRPPYRYRPVPVNEAKIRPYTIHHTPYPLNPQPSTLSLGGGAPTLSLGWGRLPCLSEGGAYPVSRKGAPTLSLGRGRLPCLSEGGAYHGWRGERAGRIECRGGAAKAPGWRGESAGLIQRGRG